MITPFKTASSGPVLTDIHREMAATTCNAFNAIWGRLAVSERWLPNTVTVLDRFHCTNLSLQWKLHAIAVPYIANSGAGSWWW